MNSQSSHNKHSFNSWFDSPYYHILYRDRDFTEAEKFVDALVEFLKPAEKAKVLDLACGKGRHAIALNKKGLDVTGVDISESSIKHCKNFENDQLHFSVHDMRNCLEKNKFDYVFNLFTSFGYFEEENENVAVIEAISRCLKSEGVFILDFINAEKAIADLVEKESKRIDHIEFNIEKKISNKILFKNISFTDNSSNFNFTESVHLLTEDDFRKYFSSCGMSIVSTFGDYMLNDFDLKNSERMILVVKKTG